jgi:hypothetical protein
VKTFKVITNNFDIFDKLSNLNILDSVKIKNTLENRKRLNTIFNNINKRGANIDGKIINNMIVITKKMKDFNLNVYYRKK